MQDRINSGQVIILDAAIGTGLERRGVPIARGKSQGGHQTPVATPSYEVNKLLIISGVPSRRLRRQCGQPGKDFGHRIVTSEGGNHIDARYPALHCL